MNERVPQNRDAEIVATLREWIRQGKPDHWLGLQARLLIEPDSAPDVRPRVGMQRRRSRA